MPDTHDPQDPRESAEDAAWREIVEHFGDRAELEPDEEVPARFDELTHPEDLFDPGDPSDAADPFDEPEDDWDRFVPPDPEPVGMPLDRRLAWVGSLQSAGSIRTRCPLTAASRSTST